MPKPDPTLNVKNDIKEAVRRLDDLRKLEHDAMRDDLKGEVKALRREITDFRDHIEKLRKAERKRLNAIRKVDVAAVAEGRTAAENRANTLAGQVTDTKDAQQVALKAETDPIRKSIDDLRQSQWTIAGGTAQGHEQATDTRARSANWGVWVGIGAAILFSTSTILFNIIMVGITLYLGMRNTK
jgi:hypothetical protein